MNPDPDSEQNRNKHLNGVPRLPLFVSLANGESVDKSSSDQNMVRFNDDNDDDVYLNKLQTRDVKKSILYM
jgi:hypothetical protein